MNATGQNLDEQLKNISPEAMANLQKAQIQGQVHLLKTGPWYYKLFMYMVIILAIGFAIFFIFKIKEAIEFQKEFDKKWNGNSTYLNKPSFS